MTQLKEGRTITEQDIEDAQTPNGGWTKAQFAKWGISWPPVKRAGNSV